MLFENLAITCKCSLISRDRFDVDVPYNKELVEIFKAIPSKNFEPISKKWSFTLKDYHTFRKNIFGLRHDFVNFSLMKQISLKFIKNSLKNSLKFFNLISNSSS